MENIDINDKIVMSRIAFERMQAKDERNDTWRNRIIVFLIIALIATNTAWLIAWNSYEYSTEIVTVDSEEGGDANYIGDDGNICNGDVEQGPEA